MNLSSHIAKHFREVITGGNWTCSNIKDTLEGITWQQATTKVYSLNTIATLTFHMNYYVSAISQVLQGGPLSSKDEYSFNHPPVESAGDWQSIVNKTLSDAEQLTGLIEQVPENKLWEDFTDKKYGIYYRHLHGNIEHIHYHLGQIALIKKILNDPSFKQNN